MQQILSVMTCLSTHYRCKVQFISNHIRNVQPIATKILKMETSEDKPKGFETF